MKFEELEIVKVVKDCGKGVGKGEIGTIVMVFDYPDEAYEVEFLDSDGNFKTLCTLTPDELEKEKNFSRG